MTPRRRRLRGCRLCLALCAGLPLAVAGCDGPEGYYDVFEGAEERDEAPGEPQPDGAGGPSPSEAADVDTRSPTIQHEGSTGAPIPGHEAAEPADDAR